MLNIFRSKQYHQLSGILKRNGFNGSDFREFKVGQAAKQLFVRGLLSQFKIFVKQTKMNHIKLLKSSLLVLHILQISERIQQNQLIDEIIRELQLIAKTIINVSPKSHARNNSYGGKKSESKDLSSNNSAKQFCDDNQIQVPENTYESSRSYVIGKLVLPLLHISEKVLYSHEHIYRPNTTMTLDSLDTCWATLNLLKKFTELSHPIEEIGRYYDEYAYAMVCTIRVLSLDVKILYRRVADYLKQFCGQLQVAVEQRIASRLQCGQQRVKQVLLLVQELQIVNEDIRVLYCSKYFVELLILNQIHMPRQFGDYLLLPSKQKQGDSEIGSASDDWSEQPIEDQIQPIDVFREGGSCLKMVQKQFLMIYYG